MELDLAFATTPTQLHYHAPPSHDNHHCVAAPPRTSTGSVAQPLLLGIKNKSPSSPLNLRLNSINLIMPWQGCNGLNMNLANFDLVFEINSKKKKSFNWILIYSANLKWFQWTIKTAKSQFFSVLLLSRPDFPFCNKKFTTLFWIKHSAKHGRIQGAVALILYFIYLGMWNQIPGSGSWRI